MVYPEPCKELRSSETLVNSKPEIVIVAWFLGRDQGELSGFLGCPLVPNFETPPGT